MAKNAFNRTKTDKISFDLYKNSAEKTITGCKIILRNLYRAKPKNVMTCISAHHKIRTQCRVFTCVDLRKLILWLQKKRLFCLKNVKLNFKHLSSNR